MPAFGLRSAPEQTPVPARTTDVFRAAAELMVMKGYGGTSIGDIAQAVGMTKAGKLRGRSALIEGYDLRTSGSLFLSKVVS